MLAQVAKKNKLNRREIKLITKMDLIETTITIKKKRGKKRQAQDRTHTEVIC